MEEKKKVALKIMEILSEVDEELLARSEQEKKLHSARKRNRFGKLAAACLCVVVVGAASHGAMNLRNGNEATGSIQRMESMPANEDSVNRQEAGAEAMPEDLGIASGERAPADGSEGAFTNNTATLKETEEPQEAESAGGQADVESCDQLPQGSREVKQEEAYAAEPCGGYLPLSLPEGYIYENGILNEESGILFVTWTKGMDYISLSVSRQESPVLLTDISRPELYDVNLYEIPYGDTVPREYWQTFNDPVFRQEDLTLELVQMRMKTVADSGDTDTPRGDFSILYEGGMLVRFNGCGSPQSIYDMLASIPE